jgi:hypothetical protein
MGLASMTIPDGSGGRLVKTKTLRLAFLAIAVVSAALMTGCSWISRPVTGHQNPVTTKAKGSEVFIPTFGVIDWDGSLPGPGGAIQGNHARLLTGANMRSVQETGSADPARPDATVFRLTFDQAGREALLQLTKARIGKRIAYVIGQYMVGSDLLKVPITDGVIDLYVDDERFVGLVLLSEQRR